MFAEAGLTNKIGYYINAFNVINYPEKSHIIEKIVKLIIGKNKVPTILNWNALYAMICISDFWFDFVVKWVFSLW